MVPYKYLIILLATSMCISIGMSVYMTIEHTLKHMSNLIESKYIRHSTILLYSLPSTSFPGSSLISLHPITIELQTFVIILVFGIFVKGPEGAIRETIGVTSHPQCLLYCPFSNQPTIY